MSRHEKNQDTENDTPCGVPDKTAALARDCYWNALDFTEQSLQEITIDLFTTHITHCGDACIESHLDINHTRFTELITLFETQALPMAQRAARKFVDDMWAAVNVYTDAARSKPSP